MVRHWWLARREIRGWYRKLLINGIGLVLCASILTFMLVFKFFEGGWATLLITGTLILLAILVKRHYKGVGVLLRRLDSLVHTPEFSAAGLSPEATAIAVPEPKFDPNGKTAVLLVSGFNGMGLHTLFGILRMFGGVFKNFVFVQVGVLDVGNFKGVQEVGHLETQIKCDVERYVQLMKRNGFYAEGICEIGVDVIDEVMKITPRIIERFPQAMFFGGQLVFEKDSFVHRLLHNHIVFALQRKLYHQGIPFVILPIRVY
ncbi:MAG: hypothetical protein HY957_08360 [Nitrospirae bacterium]|nr:hypothetical protein [Nitrospirota bacterium]